MPLSIDKSSPLRKNALPIIGSGRLQMMELETSGWDDRITKVTARVESSRPGGPKYAVDLLDGEWRCTCPLGLRREPCKHVHAVQMVTTGHQS